MEKYVTKGHFDATIQQYVTQEHLDTTIAEFRNEVMTRFDEIMIILRRLDQERIVTVESIRQIKQHLQLT